MPPKRGRGRGRGVLPRKEGSDNSPSGPQRPGREPDVHGASAPPRADFFTTPAFDEDAPSHRERATPSSSAPERPRKTPTVNPDELGIVLSQKMKISSNLPTRPGFGDLGRKIRLVSNCFQIKIPSGFVYHYDVDVTRRNTNLGREEAAADEYENIKRYRCLNTKKNRRVVELMIRTNRNFVGMYPAYDGMKNLYTRTELRVDFPMKCEVILPDEGHQGEEADPQNMRREVFEVLIKPAKKDGSLSCAVSLDALHAFFDGRTCSIPQESIVAIETILRHGPCLRFTPVGRSFFYPPNLNNLNPIGGGLEIWYGYHQSIRIGEWAPTVVLNTTATTFWQEGPILNFVADLLGLARVEDLNRRPNLTDADIRKISKKLKNRKCVVTHLRYPKKCCILKLTRDSARNLSFNVDEGRITIAEYFRQRYNIVLRFPNLPCVQVKPVGKNICFPIEVCNFIPGEHSKTELTPEQRNAMIQFTTLSPEDKLKEIKHIRRERAAYERDGSARHFETEVSPEPISLDARVLDPPSIVYKNDKRIRPKDGSWNMRDIQFVEDADIKRWILLNFEFRLQDFFIQNFVEEIKKQGRNLGIRIGDPFTVDRIRNNINIEQLLRKQKPNTDLAIVILPSVHDPEVYGEIKRVAEILIGLTTQCIKAETVKKVKGKGGPQIVCNLWSKINAKMGGQNSHLFVKEIPDILNKPVIVMGADVNHAAPAARHERQPSLAACVGSLDSRLTRYAVRVKPQINSNNDKKTIEEIIDLEAMVKELLLAFYRSTNKKKPEKIIFYRDGVSEGQFKTVREHEVACVRRACKSLQVDYEPGLTFIIVQKRHAVRFFPKDSREGVGRQRNVPPGTVVDTDVTHKVHHDFFLSSQNGLIGTSRPSHYTVVEDDNHFTANDMQKMTYQLCHLNVRCTKSVSIPAPVSYADLVAYRSRIHLNAAQHSQMASSESRHSDAGGADDGLLIPKDIMDGVKIFNTFENSMYFV